MIDKTAFPNFQQEVASKTCGPNCLLNMYTYFGIQTTLDKILSDLKIDKKTTTYLPQLASHLNKNGLETLILTSNPHEVTWEWKDMTKRQIINKLTEWIVHNKKDRWIKDIKFLLTYLKDGGHIKIVDLTTEVIDDYLHNGFLILSCLEESWLWGKRKIKGKVQFDDVKGHTRGHFIVLYGKTNNDYLISDPYPTGLQNRERLYQISKNKLLISTLVWGAQVLAIKK